jgi:hypothetical protein
LILLGELVNTSGIPENRKSGTSGAEHSGAVPAKIDEALAHAKRSRKEAPVTQKERLLKSLLERPDRTLMNIKFLRGPQQATEEEFCAEVNDILFAVDNNLTEPVTSFPEPTKKQIDVKEFAKQFA